MMNNGGQTLAGTGKTTKPPQPHCCLHTNTRALWCSQITENSLKSHVKEWVMEISMRKRLRNICMIRPYKPCIVFFVGMMP